jgi:hypothetical protein
VWLKIRNGGGRKVMSHLGRMDKTLTGSEARTLRKLKKEWSGPSFFFSFGEKAEGEEGILRKKAKK